MAAFSVNLVRQFYVVNKPDDLNIAESSIDGSISCLVKNALGKFVSTDVVKPEDIDWIKFTSADAGVIKPKAVTITFDENALKTLADPNGKGIRDHILRINLKQFIGMSDEDIYQKYAVARYTTRGGIWGFVTELIFSLVKNLGREDVRPLKVLVGGTLVTRAHRNKEGLLSFYTVDDDGNELLITELNPVNITLEEDLGESEYMLGVKSLRGVNFEVVPAFDDEDGIEWASITETTGTPIPNSYKVADMEYFYHGYRGDLYRNMGWPDVINTKYLAEPTAKEGYHLIDIQYHYKGDNEDIQRSAKTLTFAILATSENESLLANLVAFAYEKLKCRVTLVGLDGEAKDASSLFEQETTGE